MKRMTIVAALALGLVLVAGLARAGGADADFSGYPDSSKIWYQLTEIRVRDAGQIGFGDGTRTAPDVRFAYDTDSGGVNLTGALNYGGLSTNTSSALLLDFQPNMALNAGTMISFIPHTDCNAGATLNVDGLGAKALYEGDGTAVESGDIKAGVPTLVIYYDSKWWQLGQSGN